MYLTAADRARIDAIAGSVPGRGKARRARGSIQGGDEFTPEALRFAEAVSYYKRTRHRPFPAWSEIWEIVQALADLAAPQEQPVDRG